MYDNYGVNISNLWPYRACQAFHLNWQWWFYTITPRQELNWISYTFSSLLYLIPELFLSLHISNYFRYSDHLIKLRKNESCYKAGGDKKITMIIMSITFEGLVQLATFLTKLWQFIKIDKYSITLKTCIYLMARK